jgi:hypothetical protein
LPENYTTVFTFDATQTNDPTGVVKLPFAMTTGDDRCAPKKIEVTELGEGIESAFSMSTTATNCPGDICDEMIFITNKVGIYSFKADVLLNSGTHVTTDFITVIIKCKDGETTLSLPVIS